MKKVELLAPAGSFDALVAAVMCGADAIYLGGTKFGARAFASNFDNEEMIKAVNYAHLYGVKIYVTVNTIIYDKEVASFLEYVTFLRKIGVDALIIQDFGMLHLLSTIYPDLELHASTQMHIHNVEALNNLKALGVKRAVLPRELPLSKINYLKKESGMDIEVFVQGALCVSYSGQCLMSYLIGGRSGNRGECAGSCRLPYKLILKKDNHEEVIDTKGDYILSPKDLYTADRIGEIIDSGVDSLKIEGRMKRPEYVAIVTSLYRKAIDSYYDGIDYKITEEEINNLMKMFNRGFTKGYIFGDKSQLLMNSKRPNHMGVLLGRVINYAGKTAKIKLTDNIAIGDGIRIISKEDIGFAVSKMYRDNQIVKEAVKGDIITIAIDGDIKAGDEVVKTTDVKLINNTKELYNSNNRKIMISGIVTGSIGQPLLLKLMDGINTVCVESDVLITEALKNPVTNEKIKEKINKIGDTPYAFENLDIKTAENIFIPLTVINDIKRKALDQLSTLRTNIVSKENALEYDFDVPTVKQNITLLKAKVKTMEQYQACIDNGVDQIYVEDLLLHNKLKDDERVVLAIPRVRKTKLNNTVPLLVGDFGSVTKASITDFSLNIVNSYAVAFMHILGARTVTMSYEMDSNNIKTLIKDYYNRYNKNPNVEVIIYGRVEAMISEYCPLNTYVNKGNTCNICKSNDKYYLRDRFHNDYPLSFSNCLMTIYNYKKLDRFNEIEALSKAGVRNFRLNFVDENYNECVDAIKLARVVR